MDLRAGMLAPTESDGLNGFRLQGCVVHSALSTPGMKLLSILLDLLASVSWFRPTSCGTMDAHVSEVSVGIVVEENVGLLRCDDACASLRRRNPSGWRDRARYCTRCRDHGPARVALSALPLKCRARDRWIGWNCKSQFNRPHLASESIWRGSSLSGQHCCQERQKLPAVGLPGQFNLPRSQTFRPKLQARPTLPSQAKHGPDFSLVRRSRGHAQ